LWFLEFCEFCTGGSQGKVLGLELETQNNKGYENEERILFLTNFKEEPSTTLV
jgi:hypothetical protein